MKNESNIYDIDGTLIRAAGYNHKMTLKEAQEKVDFYKEKLQKLDQNDPKYDVYTTYIRNLSGYIYNLYANMKPGELSTELDRLNKQQTTNEQIEKAINELKEEIESEDGESTEDIPEQNTIVDGEGRPETVMDEYVDFEEIPA